MPGKINDLRLSGKNQKVTGAKASKTGNSALSAQFVQDSDDSDDDSLTREKAVTKLTTKNSATRHSKSFSSHKPVQPNSDPTKKAKLPSPAPENGYSSSSGRKDKSNSEDSESEDSEIDSSSGNESPRPASKDLHGTKNESKPVRTPSFNINSIGLSENPSSNARESESNGSDSEEEAEESSGKSRGSDTRDESESESESDKASSTSRPNGRQDTVLVPQRTIPPYEPPQDFEAASITFEPSSHMDGIFAPMNLEGKQIWHITTPASVPITSVHDIPMQKTQDGSSILSYKGTDYGLVPDTADSISSEPALLFPSSPGNEYRSTTIPISSTLHLRQLLNLPSHKADASHITPRPRNEQPEGLKMRFQPFGLSSSSESDEEAEILKVVPQFRKPPPVSPSCPSPKRKFAEIELQETGKGDSPVKSKKQKSRKEKPHHVEESAMDIDKTPAHRTQESAASPDISQRQQVNGTTSPRETTPTVESKQAKAARRKADRLARGSQEHSSSEMPLHPDPSVLEHVARDHEVAHRDEDQESKHAKAAKRKAERLARSSQKPRSSQAISQTDPPLVEHEAQDEESVRRSLAATSHSQALGEDSEDLQVTPSIEKNISKRDSRKREKHKKERKGKKRPNPESRDVDKEPSQNHIDLGPSEPVDTNIVMNDAPENAPTSPTPQPSFPPSSEVTLRAKNPKGKTEKKTAHTKSNGEIIYETRAERKERKERNKAMRKSWGIEESERGD